MPFFAGNATWNGVEEGWGWDGKRNRDKLGPMADKVGIREIWTEARGETTRGLLTWIGGRTGACLTVGGFLIGLFIGAWLRWDPALTGIAGSGMAALLLLAFNLHRAEVRIWRRRAERAENSLRAINQPSTEDVLRRDEVAAFTTKADVDNKIQAIDRIRLFRRANAEPVERAVISKRLSFSQDTPTATAADAEQIRKSLWGMYAQLSKLRDDLQQYRALVRIISDPPNKESLYRDVDLLKAALDAGAIPLVHYHQNGIYGWIQLWQDWWRNADTQLLELRAKLAS